MENEVEQLNHNEAEEVSELRPVWTGITTEQLGWPNSKLELYKMEEEWYFRVDQVLMEFNLKSHIEKNGFKASVDKLLMEQGFQHPFVFKNGNTKERTFILHSAAITLLLMLRVKSSNESQDVKALRKFLVSSALPLGLSKYNLTNSTIAPEHPRSTPCEEIHSELPIFATPQTTSSARKTPKCSPVSTVKLIEAREFRIQHNGQGNTRTRALDVRIKQQKDALLDIATNIHHGTKEDLVSGIAEMVNKVKPSSSRNEWDGYLTVQDIIDISKRAHDHTKKISIYDILTKEHSAKNNHISAMEILKMQDHCSMTEVFRCLRRKLAGFFDSERETDKLKSKFNKEFEVIWEPAQSKTGYRINPEILIQTLGFVYPWLTDPKKEWWRLYGDARTYGGRNSLLSHQKP